MIIFSFLTCGSQHERQQYQETGMASFYNDKFEGKKTASGEKYKASKFTAAHKSLKFNTLIKVTNLKNKKTVIVRVNDRGPFKKNRIVDVSKAAARKLNMEQDGIVNVKIEVVEKRK
ncbi:septal ring lytic transglycosylase RlpA family protein [Fulvivirgaceae bacterium BMA10]|uniref:Probable endolytic peptidoglycan transglycosylase RlpA n=1 Tax=Splendidivirga corallicola TaxID=3051826 RepID=A0ABT8KPA7_9BACT|nr:septal ring lytic transglycosylase RlpA family protein [Fulvivirgaceae bacterium BMA10]